MPEVIIPDWIVKYDKANYQSGAGKAVRFLIESVASQSLELAKLREENERLKGQKIQAGTGLFFNPESGELEMSELRKSWTPFLTEIRRLRSLPENEHLFGTIDGVVSFIENRISRNIVEIPKSIETKLRASLTEKEAEIERLNSAIREIQKSNAKIQILIVESDIDWEIVATSEEVQRQSKLISAALTKANPQP